VLSAVAMTDGIDRYAVIGRPIRHTVSPLVHGLFAEQTGQAMTYEVIEGPSSSSEFAAVVRAFIVDGGKGMNVTAPFKADAFSLADEVSERAWLSGAANTLTFTADGRIHADTYDGLALCRDIEVNLGQSLAGRRLLLLGAGGAARAAIAPFVAAGPAEFVVANRTLSKAAELAELGGRLGGTVRACGYDSFDGLGSFDVVVNATSASLTGELPPVPMRSFDPAGLAYDLAYGRGLTPFLHHAQAAGVAHLADGAGMLVEQAADAFARWRGLRPRTETVIAELAAHSN